jgi:hypothetical protein
MLILLLAFVVFVVGCIWLDTRPCRHKWYNITIAGGDGFNEIDRRCTKCGKYEEVLATKDMATGKWNTVPRRD